MYFALVKIEMIYRIGICISRGVGMNLKHIKLGLISSIGIR